MNQPRLTHYQFGATIDGRAAVLTVASLAPVHVVEITAASASPCYLTPSDARNLASGILDAVDRITPPSTYAPMLDDYTLPDGLDLAEQVRALTLRALELGLGIPDPRNGRAVIGFARRALAEQLGDRIDTAVRAHLDAERERWHASTAALPTDAGAYIDREGDLWHLTPDGVWSIVGAHLATMNAATAQQFAPFTRYTRPQNPTE